MAGFRTLPKSEWQAFFDGMAKALVGKRAGIEVAALDLGDQRIAERAPLLGITYDSAGDLVDVAVGGLKHLIRHPRDIAVQEGPGGLEAVAVVDGDGARQVVSLTEPLGLAAAKAR